MRKTLPVLARQLPETVYIPENFPLPSSKVDYDTFRQELGVLQELRCPVCSTMLDGICDVHEGIVTKGDVQGWPKPWRVLIINKYNCILVHRACHTHGLKEMTWEHKCDLFGEDEIRKWYYALPFRHFPREFGRLDDNKTDVLREVQD